MARDPELFALKSAVRAALVVPAVFGLADAIGEPQTTLFAAFGTVALLVFTDFGGSWRTRLLSYALLALAGAGLIALGTVCSRDAWLAAGAMAAVGFVVLFAGIVSGGVAAATSAAILVFVLAVTVPAGVGELPARLAGWGLASVAATAAALLLWPRRPRAAVRADAARACRALAELVEASGEPGADRLAARRAAAADAVAATRRRFVATPYRPSGATGPTAALGHLVEDLAWVASFTATPADLARAAAPCFPREGAAVRAATAQTLRAAAVQLEGGAERPDLARLERVRERIAAEFMERVGAWRAGRDARLPDELAEAFELRVLSYASWQLGSDALRAAGRTAPDPDEPRAARARPARASSRAALAEARQLADAHASMRSVWLRNSVRGAVGLALAVLVAQLADVQHGFWVVLATLSVLRSQALSTGATILQALAGTAAGIVAGGLLVWLLGSDEAVLWAALAPATLLAAYAPRAISFAAGQAAFSLLVLLVFNLIEPVGWKVGIVRAEDIAIGTAISLLAGLLLWPRGAAAVLRDSVASAYAASADYLSATVSVVLGGGPSAELDGVRRAAISTGRRLDDTFRQYLGERSSGRLPFDELATLVAGTTRLRRSAHTLRAGHSLLPLRAIGDGSAELTRERTLLERETEALCAWYVALAASVAQAAAPPVPRPEREASDHRPRLVGAPGATDRDDAELLPGLALAWSHEHLVHLRALEPHLAAAAGELARR